MRDYTCGRGTNKLTFPKVQPMSMARFVHIGQGPTERMPTCCSWHWNRNCLNLQHWRENWRMDANVSFFIYCLFCANLVLFKGGTVWSRRLIRTTWCLTKTNRFSARFVSYVSVSLPRGLFCIFRCQSVPCAFQQRFRRIYHRPCRLWRQRRIK